MSTRIDSALAPQINTTTHLQTPGATQQIPYLGEQIRLTLFSNPKPRLVDPASFPDLAVWLRSLNQFRKKLAVMAGDHESEYELLLAEGTIGSIDEEGRIYVGASFIRSFARSPSVLVGVLAHEIGHRPKRWKQERYRIPRELTRRELEALCRHEETRADLFSGKALAELELPCEPLIAFLHQVQSRPHPEYLPADARAEVIREAHAGHSLRTDLRRKLFPDYDRATAAKNYLGEL